VAVVQRPVGGHRQAAVDSPGDGQQALTGLEGRVRPRFGASGETAAVVLLPGSSPIGQGGGLLRPSAVLQAPALPPYGPRIGQRGTSSW